MCQHLRSHFMFVGVLLFAIFIYPIIFMYGRLKSTQAITSIRYDFIIVGGGTTGCVLAAKLSNNMSNTVLLIEAGDHFNILASVPLLTVMMQGTKYDWNFKTTSQIYSSYGLRNQAQSLPRGKGLGGSNQINYMVHDDHIAQDLENLKSYGITDWDIDQINPYMKRIFNTTTCLHIDDKHCLIDSTSSLFNITEMKSDLGDLLYEAVNELNNDNDNIQYHSVKSLISRGQRWTSYHSHLKPIMDRENLHILLNNQVVKIEFADKHAIGVQVIDKQGFSKTIYSRREVILSAGTFGTPTILLGSGVGPFNKASKLPLLHRLDGLGKNLHDQLIMPLYVSIEKPLSVTFEKILKFSEFWKYVINGQGILSTTPISGFVRMDDVQVLLFGMGSVDKEILGEIANFEPEYFESLFPFHSNSSREGFVILSSCLKPESRGDVNLNVNGNIPVINPIYLSNRIDLNCMIKAVKLAIAIIDTKAMKSIGAKIHWPKFLNCDHIPEPWKDNKYLGCIIRSVALTAHHSGGTCRMGSELDRFAVVDKQLKVRGLTGLRIMDASIFPEPLISFPNSLLVAMAEYGADIITNKTSIYSTLD